MTHDEVTDRRKIASKKSCENERRKNSGDLCASQRLQTRMWNFQFIFLRKRQYKRSHAIQWFQLKRAVAFGAEFISAFSSECSKENKGWTAKWTLCAACSAGKHLFHIWKIFEKWYLWHRGTTCLFVCLLAAAPPTRVCNVHTMDIVHECRWHVGTAQVHIRESWRMISFEPIAICGPCTLDAGAPMCTQPHAEFRMLWNGEIVFRKEMAHSRAKCEIRMAHSEQLSRRLEISRQMNKCTLS